MYQFPTRTWMETNHDIMDNSIIRNKYELHLLERLFLMVDLL